MKAKINKLFSKELLDIFSLMETAVFKSKYNSFILYGYYWMWT